MFDTMTMTKIIGALCGTFLVFLLGNWAAESLYHVGSEDHGDGYVQAYAIAVEETAGAEVVTEVDFAVVFASADSAKGEKVFGKCKACHKLEDGANSTGPYLYGVVGRDIASAAGFGYSTVLEGLPGDWTPEIINEFLTNPKAFAAGNKMSFAGLKDAQDRADLIAYLGTLGG